MPDLLLFTGLTLLHWACDRGHPSIVQFLLSNQANINIEDPDGQTPLHYACSCGHPDIAKILLENKANPKLQDKEGATPLQVSESEEVKKLVSTWIFWKGSGESFSH